MKSVQPLALHEGGHLVIFAKSQPDLYFALPASVDQQGTVMTEWELSAEDLACVLNGGRIRLWLLYTDVNKGKPLTPISMETVDNNAR